MQPGPSFNVVREARIEKDGKEEYVVFFLELVFEEEVYSVGCFKEWEEVVAYFEEMGSVERVLEDNFSWDSCPEIHVSWDNCNSEWEGSVVEYFGDRKFKPSVHDMERTK